MFGAEFRVFVYPVRTALAAKLPAETFGENANLHEAKVIWRISRLGQNLITVAHTEMNKKFNEITRTFRPTFRLKNCPRL